MNICVTWGEALAVTCGDSQGLFSFCTCSQSYKPCTLFNLNLTWRPPSADPLLNARFFFFFFYGVLISFSDRSVLPFLSLSLISFYLFLPSLSWLPFLAFLKIPLVSFSSDSGHIRMQAHTLTQSRWKISYWSWQLLKKGAPTKCCNPFIIRLLTHSTQAALPFGSSVLSPSLPFVCMRKEQNGENISKRWLRESLQGDVGTGNPWLSVVEWEAWWLQGIGQLKCLFMSVGRFGGHVQQLHEKALHACSNII